MYRNLSFIDVLEINTYKNDKQMFSSCRKASLTKSFPQPFQHVPYRFWPQKILKNKHISVVSPFRSEMADGIKIPLTSAPHAEKVELARRESSPQPLGSAVDSDEDGWLLVPNLRVLRDVYFLKLKADNHPGTKVSKGVACFKAWRCWQFYKIDVHPRVACENGTQKMHNNVTLRPNPSI